MMQTKKNYLKRDYPQYFIRIDMENIYVWCIENYAIIKVRKGIIVLFVVPIILCYLVRCSTVAPPPAPIVTIGHVKPYTSYIYIYDVYAAM